MSDKRITDAGRECPHCKGSLAHYEDPVAVALLSTAQAEVERLKQALNSLAASCNEIQGENHIIKQERDAFKAVAAQLFEALEELRDVAGIYPSRTKKAFISYTALLNGQKEEAK